MSPYHSLDHTADSAFRIDSETMNGIFEEAAEALFEVICETETVECSVTRQVSAEAESLEELLHDWLSELLYIHESQNLLFRNFDVKVRDGSLKASAHGEQIDRTRHELKTEVKAVTYHMMSVKHLKTGWTATVLFDV